MTRGAGAKLTPEQGTVSIRHCLFADLKGNGWYYGSDAIRSPAYPSRDPGQSPFDGTYPWTAWKQKLFNVINLISCLMLGSHHAATAVNTTRFSFSNTLNLSPTVRQTHLLAWASLVAVRFHFADGKLPFSFVGVNSVSHGITAEHQIVSCWRFLSFLF